ncbi:MAG: PadR family transcriptional regulator [Gemmatimonadetes bacterium]|nr:PadR family transcriptional regulator [Gemmatimonadota bacterium]
MPKKQQVEALLPLTHLSYHVLLVLAGTKLHGYGIIKEVYDRTGGAMDLETGTLYAAIKRLRDEALIDVAPPPRDDPGADSRRRYYTLTDLGKKVLEAESERLARLVNLAREKKLVGEVVRPQRAES